MATLNLGRIKPVFRGAYAGGTAYVVDDIVTDSGETFICILASTGNATSNATYWTKLAQKGTDGTDIGTTLTTQGDILIRDGSGIARLGYGTSGQVLKTQGSGANPVWGDAGGGLQSIQTFTSSGTYTKPSGINKVKVIVTGAGGGGGGGSSNYNGGTGGGAGGTAIELIDVSSLSSTVAVTVGTGGGGGSSNATGGTGGTSSFGAYCSATGGNGGGGADQAIYGTGGTGSSGNLNITGGDGDTGGGGQNSDDTSGGDGGSSFWGGGGNKTKVNNNSAHASDGQAFGSGGGGGNHIDGSNYLGGTGKAGVVYIEEYK